MVHRVPLKQSVQRGSGSMPDFFEARQLRGQTSDLGIEFIELLVIHRFERSFGLEIIREETHESFQHQGFPLVDLGRARAAAIGAIVSSSLRA